AYPYAQPAEERRSRDTRAGFYSRFAGSPGDAPLDQPPDIVEKEKYRGQRLGDVQTQQDSEEIAIDPLTFKMQIRTGQKAGNRQTGDTPMKAENDRPPPWSTALGNGFYRLKYIEIDDE